MKINEREKEIEDQIVYFIDHSPLQSNYLIKMILKSIKIVHFFTFFTILIYLIFLQFLFFIYSTLMILDFAFKIFIFQMF
jgi:hypothetical protein